MYITLAMSGKINKQADLDKCIEFQRYDTTLILLIAYGTVVAVENFETKVIPM